MKLDNKNERIMYVYCSNIKINFVKSKSEPFKHKNEPFKYKNESFEHKNEPLIQKMNL